MTRVQMNPNFERDALGMILARANEAVAAVGPAGGSSAEQILAQLTVELEGRGVDLPRETLIPAAEAISEGESFEFRG